MKEINEKDFEKAPEESTDTTRSATNTSLRGRYISVCRRPTKPV